MQLLIQRDRFITDAKKSGFALWAKYELTEDEQILIQKYGIYNMLLVEGKPRELLKAVIWATFLTVVTVFIFTWKAPDEIRVIVLILGILSYPLIIYLIYQQIEAV